MVKRGGKRDLQVVRLDDGFHLPMRVVEPELLGFKVWICVVDSRGTGSRGGWYRKRGMVSRNAGLGPECSEWDEGLHQVGRSFITNCSVRPRQRSCDSQHHSKPFAEMADITTRL